MTEHPPRLLLDRLTYAGAAGGILFLWTLLEHQVIEPFGLYNYMPFYRVQGMCVWDVGVIALIAAAFLIAIRPAKESP
jgi:hypothetical protein